MPTIFLFVLASKLEVPSCRKREVVETRSVNIRTTVSWTVTLCLKLLVNLLLLSIRISTSNTDYWSVINRQTDRHLIELDTELNLTCYATKNDLLSTTEVQTNTGI